MIYLILSIVLSSLLFVGFKWFDMKQINLLMAITGNYIACIITGLLMNTFQKTEGVLHLKGFDHLMIMKCMALGTLFFAVFYAMGYASARIGVGITGASAKMSLVIPFFYNAMVFGERSGLHTLNQVYVLSFALIAMVLMSIKKGEKITLKQMLLPSFIFIGSGIIDLSINLLRIELERKGMDNETSIIFIFSGALCAALIILSGWNRHLFKDQRSLGYGLLLGIPNYMSILMMIKALGSGEFQFNAFYMVNNTGIMLICFLLGLVLFKEKITLTKALGLLLSIVTIYLLLFSTDVKN